MKPLKGKHILVTGSTQGVGEAIAQRAARAGAEHLILTGRNRQRAESVAQQLECPATFIPADLGSVDACKKLFAESLQAAGKIDCLVNAAGATDRGGALDTTPELWEHLYAVNVRAPFFLMQAFLNHCIERKAPGSIVNVLSITSHGGPPFLTTYASTKSALATITKNVANAVRKYRIRVNGINLGWTDTPQEHYIQTAIMGKDADWLREAEAGQPFGQLIKPAEIARLAVFLLGKESGIMTGSIIDYDQNVVGTHLG